MIEEDTLLDLKNSVGCRSVEMIENAERTDQGRRSWKNIRMKMKELSSKLQGAEVERTHTTSELPRLEEEVVNLQMESTSIM